MLRDSTNNYRGGVRFEYNRWHVTLEQGGTTYKDDDQASFNGVNYGDRTTPLLGSTLLLNTLTQTYGIRGSSVYTKVLATASPFSWMDLYGQFLYSSASTDARYFDIASGNFALLSSLLLYSGQYNIGTSAANAPHTAGQRGHGNPALPAAADHRIVHHQPVQQYGRRRAHPTDSDHAGHKFTRPGHGAEHSADGESTTSSRWTPSSM